MTKATEVTLGKSIAKKGSGGQSQTESLIAILKGVKGYTMTTAAASEALMPGDKRADSLKKKSFASAKSRAWSDHDEYMVYTDNKEVITLVGQRDPDNKDAYLEYVHS